MDVFELAWQDTVQFEGRTASVGNWRLCATGRMWSLTDGRNYTSGAARSLREAKLSAESAYRLKVLEWR